MTILEEEDSNGILVVIDDDPATRMYVGALAGHGSSAEIKSFGDAREALNYINATANSTNPKDARVDAILCDIKMPDMSGHDFLLELHSAGHEMPVVFLSGFLDEETLTQALRLGAFDVMSKPPDQKLMPSTMSIAMTVGRKRRQIQHQFDVLKKRLNTEEMTPQLGLDVLRAIENRDKERRTIALLSLRNVSMKATE